MLIRFIAHAGFYLEHGSSSLLIDPWFTGSTISEPILKGISGHQTIDFLRPKPKDSIETFHPDGILISHLHTHHSVERDIDTIIANTKKTVALIYPESTTKEQTTIGDHFAPKKNASLTPVAGGEKITIGDFKISVLKHPAQNHLAYFIESADGSFLHIADSLLNRDVTKRLFDSLWNPFFDLKPDYIALTAGGHSLRFTDQQGKQRVSDSTCLTSVEAAQLVERINPKAASIMGIFNNSIWRNNTEYAPPSPFIEEEFYWAMEWIAPHIKVIHLRPGHTITTQDADTLS